MAALKVIFPEARDLVLEPFAFEGYEAVGAASQFIVQCWAAELPPKEDVLGKRCVILIETPAGMRALTGVVTEYRRVALVEHEDKRRS